MGIVLGKRSLSTESTEFSTAFDIEYKLLQRRLCGFNEMAATLTLCRTIDFGIVDFGRPRATPQAKNGFVSSLPLREI
jgi:hypothetical protein